MRERIDNRNPQSSAAGFRRPQRRHRWRKHRGNCRQRRFDARSGLLRRRKPSHLTGTSNSTGGNGGTCTRIGAEAPNFGLGGTARERNQHHQRRRGESSANADRRQTAVRSTQAAASGGNGNNASATATGISTGNGIGWWIGPRLAPTPMAAPVDGHGGFGGNGGNAQATTTANIASNNLTQSTATATGGQGGRGTAARAPVAASVGNATAMATGTSSVHRRYCRACFRQPAATPARVFRVPLRERRLRSCRRFRHRASGSAQSDATSNGGAISSVHVTATAQIVPGLVSHSEAFADSEAPARSESLASGIQAASFATATPSASDVSAALGSASNVSAALNGGGNNVLGLLTLSLNNMPTGAVNSISHRIRLVHHAGGYFQSDSAALRGSHFRQFQRRRNGDFQHQPEQRPA